MSSSPFDLTKAERQLIEGSFPRIVSPPRQFATFFYDLLFERHPEVRGMFSDDLEAQKDKFVLMLATLVEYLDDPHRFHEQVWGLGARHAEYGAKPTHYQAVGECFLETLRKDPEFGADELEAWQRLYSVIATSMLIVSR